MNLIKTAGAPAQERKLTLDVFKDKMMTEVQHEKGGGSTVVCTVTATKAIEWGIELAEWILDDCHD